MGGWPRSAGLRVVMAWPDSEFAPPPPPRGRGRVRLAGLAGGSLVFGGVVAILVALLAQQHAPSPAASAAGRVGPDGAKGPSLHQSPPVAGSRIRPFPESLTIVRWWPEKPAPGFCKPLQSWMIGPTWRPAGWLPGVRA